MITNKGNSIITKYLLGQAPEYASYIAMGVGATPLSLNENDNSSPSKENMDFEAFRIPVTSRGLVNDRVTIDLDSWYSDGENVTITTSTFHGARPGEEISVEFSSAANTDKEGLFIVSGTTSNTISYSDVSSSASWTASVGDTGTVSYSRERMIFKGQLPVDQYYKMTEIAIYPAATNNLAQQYDSKVVAGFLATESWNIVIDNAQSIIPTISQSISTTDGDITPATFIDPETRTEARALFVNSENDAFTFYNRKIRYEGPRFYNLGLMIAGDVISFNDDNLDVSSSTSYVVSNDLSLDFSKNSPNDYVKIAMSVVSSSYASDPPDRTRVRIDFIDSATEGKATIKEVINGSELLSSRYYVISKQLNDFSVDENFNWSRVNQIRIYAQTVDVLGTPLDDYIVFDGIRLDNINTPNPLYGMIAYSRLGNQYESGQPVEKIENSQGYIEYRIGVNIV